VNIISKQNKSRVGLDFVHGQLIGWLWFAIGFPALTPVNESSVKRTDGEVILIKDYEGIWIFAKKWQAQTLTFNC